jgi:hypothetical protein
MIVYVYRGPTELVQLCRYWGEFTSVQERCLTFIRYGLAISLAYTSGEKGGILLVQIISTYLPGS